MADSKLQQPTATQPDGMPQNIFGVGVLQQPGSSSFDQKPQGVSTTDAPNYTGYSRGTERVPINKAGQVGLAGAGQSITDAFKLSDDVIKQYDDMAVRQGVKDINKKFGVDDVAAAAASGIAPGALKGDVDVYGQGQLVDGYNPTGTQQNVVGGKTASGAPPGVVKYGQAIGTLSDQYNQGLLSNSAFYGQITALTKQINAQFPGYEDYTEQQIRQKTGIIPAEALRKATLADLDAQARAKAGGQNKDLDYLRTNIGKLGADAPAEWAKVQADPSYIPTAMAHVYTMEGLKSSLETQQALFQADQSKATDKDQNAQSWITKDVAIRTQNAMARKSDISGMSAQDLIQQVQKIAATGAIPDPKLVDQMQKQVAFSQNQLQQELFATYYLPSATGAPGMGTYVRDPNRLKEIISNGTAPMAQGLNNLVNGQEGIAMWSALSAKHQIDARTQEMYTNFPVTQNLAFFKNIGGDNLISRALVTMDGAKNTAWTTQIAGAAMFQSMYDPRASVDSVTQKAVQMAANKADAAQVATAILDGHITMITDRTKDATSFGNARDTAHKMFDPQNSDYLSATFSPNTQGLAWQKFASDGFQKRMQELSKDDPALWHNYQQTMGNWANGVLHQQAAELHSLETTGRFDFKYDPKSNTVSGQVKPEYKKDYYSDTRYGGRNPQRIENVVAPLNQTLERLGSIIKGKGTDVSTEIQKTLSGQGLALGNSFPAEGTRQPVYPASGLGGFMKRVFTGPTDEEIASKKDQGRVPGL